jgi:hypothetical protein
VQHLQESLQDSWKHSALVLSDPSTDCHLNSECEVSDGQDLAVIDEGLRSEGENRSEILDLDLVIVDPGDHGEEAED